MCKWRMFINYSKIARYPWSSQGLRTNGSLTAATHRSCLSFPFPLISITQYHQQIVWCSALEASHSTQHPQPSCNNVAWWQCQGRRHHQGGCKAPPLVSTTKQRRGRGIWIRASPFADPDQEHLDRGSRISLPAQIPNLFIQRDQEAKDNSGAGIATSLLFPRVLFPVFFWHALSSQPPFKNYEKLWNVCNK